MFTLFSFLGRKFDALSETAMRRLDYALRVLFVLITAMVLVTLWIMFHAADSDIVPCFFTVIFILFCVDIGISLKKIKTKEFSELRESCFDFFTYCLMALFSLFMFTPYKRSFGEIR